MYVLKACKQDETVHIDLDKRPVVYNCDLCHAEIRGRTRMLSGDKMYFIRGKKICRNCLEPFADEHYLMDDIL